MKLIRFRQNGSVKPGVFKDEKYYDVSSFVRDYDENFFASNGVEKLHSAFQSGKQEFPVVKSDVSLDCPVARPSKIVCIGLNYSDHAKETMATVPSEPVIFLKSTTAICGPFDDIIIPRDSVKTDWEVELAVVVGKKASYVEEHEAMDYVAGYCVHNDISEREFQLERGGTWDKGKGCDTFAPLGPYLVTKDEISNVDDLRMWLTVNGKVFQNSTTANLIFKIPLLVSYTSRFMTLLPGDIISTGTPAGVGLGQTPNIYLKPGDIVELSIDGLGTARQTVKAYEKN
ncbi:MAG TPA: fumarylacetoacetate hydrolase family protein [Chitinophagaceae bacterium]